MRVLSWLRTKGAARVSQAHAGKGKGDGKGKGKGDGKGKGGEPPYDAVVSWKPETWEVYFEDGHQINTGHSIRLLPPRRKQRT